MTPIVSVLMPSRQRAQLAQQSIESLGKGNFETLIWVDDDDPELLDYMQLDARVFVRPRVGYHGFHTMTNFLAKQAKGDWLLLWNDDAVMRSEQWLTPISLQDHKVPAVLNFFAPGNSNNNLFPLISRSMYNAMGHFSLSPHCDSWVQDIANELDIHKDVLGISAEHRRDLINDETKQHSQGAYSTTSPLHSSPEMVNLRLADTHKVKGVLK